jgi:hypothetical protein
VIAEVEVATDRLRWPVFVRFTPNRCRDHGVAWCSPMMIGIAISPCASDGAAVSTGGGGADWKDESANDWVDESANSWMQA